ncbi:hypothetical protein ACTFIU_003619 [Dictyostelium citrinum]
MDQKYEVLELKEEGVAIVGIGFRIPSGNNENSISSPIDLFNNLKNGFDGVIISIYSPIHKKKNDIEEFQQTISNLYCQNGYNINFKCQFNNKKSNQSIDLPLYQWDDELYFTQSESKEIHRIEGPPIDHLGISNSYNSPLNNSYKTLIDIKNKPFQYLKGHMVKGKYYFPGCGYIDNID